MKIRLLACTLLLALLCISAASFAQGVDDDETTFKNFQLSCTRVSQAWGKYNDTLRKEFEKKGITYPAHDIYLRVFKSQNEMELWARNNPSSEYKLIKSMRICALSGILGPKRIEGDRQVPEGSYFIEDFNPKSDFYLSLLLNYPNYSDMVMGGKQKLGGDIYIHGGCVTVGCMPMTDEVIQQLYVICLNAKFNGEEYIPIQIYPTRFDKGGLNFLGREYGKDEAKQKFWVNLKSGYDYFEKYHKLLPVMYTPDGKYVFSNN
ncbi:MAG: L,D-transpeptidase family protein [Taibaiella sp.]|nr:L,D-transpeptidase family protein [Taibaiella sp.]